MPGHRYPRTERNILGKPKGWDIVTFSIKWRKESIRRYHNWTIRKCLSILRTQKQTSQWAIKKKQGHYAINFINCRSKRTISVYERHNLLAFPHKITLPSYITCLRLKRNCLVRWAWEIARALRKRNWYSFSCNKLKHNYICSLLQHVHKVQCRNSCTH